ncbi:MAG: hypothetical protein IPL90_03080 [Holophagales bacterium]|nr:hypothetical protein [Holophagales bacterium]
MSGRRILGPLVVGLFGALGIALVVVPPAGSARQPATQAGPVPETAVSGRTPLEEKAVSAAVVSGLRPATDEDAADSEARDDLRDLYGDYRPYFVRGDFDADGRLDFAQAFLRREGPEPLFDVAVFFGTPEGFSPPVWVDRGLMLSGGDLTIDRSVLIVTEDVERDVSRRLRWVPAERRFIDVDVESEGEDGEPWTEPDGRVGTTA